jgi:hypothetical protein
VRPGGVDGQRTPGARIGDQHRSGRETLLRLVGADIHDDLAADAVRSHDPADDQQHRQ